MNKLEAVNWKTFKATLLMYPDLDLQFKYAEGKFVDHAYHITEIKQAPITSVDCGGVVNTWTEIIVQLWVPEDQQQERSMNVSKALGIVELVEKMLPLNPDGIVKIEFGNAEFDTRQMLPQEMMADGEHLTINLHADAVQCKATSRGGSCGTEKPRVALKNLVIATENSCTPGGGCC